MAGWHPRGRYRFQHALYQQVLYEQLGTARRMQYHQHIGRRLEASHGARAGEIAAQLAMHFERGGEGERAVRYLQQAADNATRRNAHHEAILALRKGLALLATLPESPERTQHELTLLLLLGSRLMAAQGYAVPDVGESYTRAYTLSQQVGEPRQRCQALQGLYRFHVLQAQLRLADEMSQQCFHLASHQHDVTLVQESYMDLGLIAFYRGDPVTARAHLERSLRLCDTPQLSTLLFGHESGVRHGFYGAMVLWLLGYADQAQQWMQDVLAQAQQGAYAQSGAGPTLCRHSCPAPSRRGDRAGIQRRDDSPGDGARLCAPCRRDVSCRGGHWPCRGTRPPVWRTSTRGWERCRVQVRSCTTPITWPCWPRRMARQVSPTVGLTCLAEALTLVEATEERWWEAEVYRLKGVAPPAPAPRYPPGDRLFAPGPRRGPPPAGQGVGAACGAEPESAVAAAG